MSQFCYNRNMIFVAYLVVINVITFAVYGLDKYKAGKQKWRISERTLLLLAFLGGSIGALLGMLIWHHKIRKPKFYLTVPLLCALLVGGIIYCLYQNNHLSVSKYEADLGLEKDVTIVQISDLHNKDFGDALIKKISEQKPDLIAVTGDVVDSRHTDYETALTFFREAVKICPVYYVTGNHEERMDRVEIEAFYGKMVEMGVHDLNNAFTDQGEYVLAGIADRSLSGFPGFKNLDEGKPMILLAHEPKYADGYKRLGADVVLSGHIHGGQIIIPGKGGLLSPDGEFFPKYYGDMYDVDGMKLVVSRGLGNSILPLRINNCPEIVVIKVH